MADNIDTRIPVDLHPQNVRAIEGFEANASVLAPTERAFANAYTEIGKVFDAREAVRTDPTMNESAQILRTDDMAQKVFARVAKDFDGERENLTKGIAHIEGQLSAPVTAKAAHPVASEIRSHVKSLDTGERMTFLRQALEGGDDTTITSVLGTVPYLSGIDAQTQATFLRMYHEKNQPHLTQRLKMMTAAKELIENRGGSVLTTLEKAVGCVEVKNKEGFVVKRILPHELRQQKAKADKAFAASAAV